MPAPPYIELDHVSKKFGKNVYTKDITLNIPFGEITGIIGPSGSGKTTILNLLIGFIKPSKGTIRFQSRDIFKDMKHVNTLFGFAVQDFSFYDELTVRENLQYFGTLYHIPQKVLKIRIPQLLKLVDLQGYEKRYANNLSSGMKRRLDIACAMIHEPKILILDEPTQDLDPILRKEVIKTVKRIKAQGKTVILTSHLLGEIDQLCDKLAILYDGEIVRFTTPVQLKKEYRKNNLDDVFEVIVQKEKARAITRVAEEAKKQKKSSSKKGNRYADMPTKQELEEVLGKKRK